MESGWINFWNEPDIYRKLNSDIKYRFSKIVFERLSTLLDDRTNNDILDFGCGEATTASWIVEAGHNLFLYDASQYYLKRAQETFFNHQRITVVSQDDYKNIPDQSIDVVVVSSVTQYLTGNELKTHIKRWANILRYGGIVILGDVVPPNSNTVLETLSLFFSSIKHNFVIGFINLILFHLTSSRYRSHLKSLNLYKYAKNDLEEYASPLGLVVSEHYENLGLISSRKTFILRGKDCEHCF